MAAIRAALDAGVQAADVDHLLAMGGLVEKQVNDAVTALIEADSGLAQQVREVDDQINQMERNIDEECLRILARRQPAASDLRLIISISKSVIDLERIGDEATKIARRAIQLCEEGEAPRGYVEVRHIGDQVRNMVRDALDAFARFDIAMMRAYLGIMAAPIYCTRTASRLVRTYTDRHGVVPW